MKQQMTIKKLLIGFEYKGLSFSAEVLIKHIGGIKFYTAHITGNNLDFILRKNSLVFLKATKGYELVLYKKDNSYEVLNWYIQSRCMDEGTSGYFDPLNLS